MEQGLRYNKGKLRYDLIHPVAQEGIVRVLTKGAEKYTVKYINKWEKIFHASNATSLNLTTANQCAVAVTKDNLGNLILSMQKGNEEIQKLGETPILQEKEIWIKLEELTLNLEKEMLEQNGWQLLENTTLQKTVINNYVTKVVKSVELPNIFILTMTIQQENSEESYVVNATTVSDSWEIMWKVLKEHSLISEKLEVVKHIGERNWEKGMSWTSIIASLKRHVAAIERGEDYDPETGELHADHVQCNAHFLSAYYKIAPQYDDRPKPRFKKIGLDIDEVICDWLGAYMEHTGLRERPTSWSFDRDISKVFDEMGQEGYEDFMMNLKPLVKPEDIPFEPHCYITARRLPNHLSEKWIDINKFPSAPVYTVPPNSSKVEAAKQAGVDVFVDDNYKNFCDLNEAGILCYLYDQPHNRRYQVGHKRIHSLKELV